MGRPRDGETGGWGDGGMGVSVLVSALFAPPSLASCARLRRGGYRCLVWGVQGFFGECGEVVFWGGRCGFLGAKICRWRGDSLGRGIGERMFGKSVVGFCGGSGTVGGGDSMGDCGCGGVMAACRGVREFLRAGVLGDGSVLGGDKRCPGVRHGAEGIRGGNAGLLEAQ